MENVNNKFLKRHKKFRTDYKKIAMTFLVLALLVALIVFWWLKLVGITITGDAFCGVEEHTHSEACYAEGELVCKIPEHTHTAECFPDDTADVEMVGDWLATFEDVEITNDVPKNLVAIAQSQLGYTESTKNFEYDDDGVKRGYTRYGEWYGSPYSPWNTTFVSFCLHYSNVKDDAALKAAGAEAMRLAWQEQEVYTSAGEYTPQSGDLIFFDKEGDGDADTVAIVLSASGSNLVLIAGDSNDQVEIYHTEVTDRILGYGQTGKLRYAKNTTVPQKEEQPQKPEKVDTNVRQPLMMFSANKSAIDLYSDLTDLLTKATIINHNGQEMGEGDTIHVGEPYTIVLEFSESNTTNPWRQFDPNVEYLTYTLPDNLQCEPFTEWHDITATSEMGTVENVGKYFIGEDGVLLVEFFDVDNEHFADKYSNVKFKVDFSGTVILGENDTDASIKFNEDVNVNLGVDGYAEMTLTKTKGVYDRTDQTLAYTIEVEAHHGVVHDVVVRDEIWYDHEVLTDTIQVTDKNGVLLDPQPTIEPDPGGSPYGFCLVGLPDLVTGEKYIITYKTKLQEHLHNANTAGLWNGAEATGKDTNGDQKKEYEGVTTTIEPAALYKSGSQASVTSADGNPVPAIKWEVLVRNHNVDLTGTVIIDTLGENLAYYTGEPIFIQRWDEAGKRMDDYYISWEYITIENNSMAFLLPEGYQFKIVYYTTYTGLDPGKNGTYTNEVGTIINNQWETAGGTATVVGVDTHVEKSAYGTDGQYVYFTVEANVQSLIKDMDGYFYVTDSCVFWGENNIFVENQPVDLVITAMDKDGNLLATFTPYEEGGPTENTYILVSPADDPYSDGQLYYMFQIFFNTDVADPATSQWLLDTDAVLRLDYKIPFSARTFHDEHGLPSDETTVGEVLKEGRTLYNEVYVNYLDGISGNAGTNYEFKPNLYKNGVINKDGTIDYTVDFINTIPGSHGNSGYLNHLTTTAYFHDVFDEMLEYVPGSLKVSCSNPWDQDSWMNRYEYNGDIEGNEIHLHASQFTYVETNPQYIGWTDHLMTLEEYYRYHGAGGKYTFTYKLRIKDEYLNTTDYSVLEFENTAEITWDEEGTSDKAVEILKMPTGLLSKSMLIKGSDLDYSINVNKNALDMVPNSDTINVLDTMSDNMSVYWESIKLYYEDENGNWINFNSEESQYTYAIILNQQTNSLTFTIPDELHVKIDYTTLITKEGVVNVHNAVSVEGKSHVTDFTDAIFRVEEHSGEATGSLHSVTLIKHDGYTHAALPGVTLYLYGKYSNLNLTLPEGVPRTIETENGETLYYIGAYTTGEDGTKKIETQYLTVGGPYALLETTPLPGYVLPEKPTFFYYYETDPDGVIQTVTTIVPVHNYTHAYVLPETGGNGTLYFGIIGITLMALPILYSMIRRRRERRLT